jgi:hypothetical protein
MLIKLSALVWSWLFANAAYEVKIMSTGNETPRYEIPEFTPEDIEQYILQGRRLRARMAGELMRNSMSALAKIISLPVRGLRPVTDKTDAVALSRHDLHSQHSA